VQQIIECVPNFSEGCHPEIIKQITDRIEQVEGVHLLDVDPGRATNRTVVTFAGPPAQVVEAAFLAIQTACELIDMRTHKGEHPRMGATDVCPLVPIAHISMEETIEWARKLAERVGRELDLPVYLYEKAATRPERINLADIRAGEYEGLPEKITHPNWIPDFGPARFNPKRGATVIGAREFLIAYNVNLNTTSVRRANSVAFDIREKGRAAPGPDGKPLKNEHGEIIRQPGVLKGVKAIGWYIREYGIAQISMNLTDINQTSLHAAFEACCHSATQRGMRVTGSELVGLLPLQVLLDAGKYFLHKQKRSAGVDDSELIKIAVKSMGLDELSPFDPNRRIIEYNLNPPDSNSPLVNLTLRNFAAETSSESPAPGGGSVAAYVGALGVALGTMVANLSSHKRGWDDQWEFFSREAEKGQHLKNTLLQAVDDDTRAFNAILQAFSLPKNSPEEKNHRTRAIQDATVVAIEVPLHVMEVALSSFELLRNMVVKGNPNSITDAGVGALCARTAVQGAYLNVKINAAGLTDATLRKAYLEKSAHIAQESNRLESEIIDIVHQHINGTA
jgi:glutamate formiminotransferase/formiminotetrahydrofolate cyclodeaminase